MANLSLFTRPGTFRRMKPEDLCKWLEPAQAYLGGHGFALPGVALRGELITTGWRGSSWSRTGKCRPS